MARSRKAGVRKGSTIGRRSMPRWLGARAERAYEVQKMRRRAERELAARALYEKREKVRRVVRRVVRKAVFNVPFVRGAVSVARGPRLRGVFAHAVQADWSRAVVCLRRKVRRQVLHALGIAGRVGLGAGGGLDTRNAKVRC